MILLAAFALASPRQDGDAAEAAMDFAAALAAWRACVAGPDDRDARYCEARLAILAPQEADGFAGWRRLEEVRRGYRELGSEAAILRIDEALAAQPDGPAAGEMRLWLAYERARRGETDAVEAIGASLDDPGAQAWVAARVKAQRLDARRRRLAGRLAAIGAAYVAVAAWRGGALRWRSAALAACMLGAVPTVFGWLYEEGLADGFARGGGVVALGVLLAGRAPVWLSVPGTLAGLGAVAWFNGWYPSLGL